MKMTKGFKKWYGRYGQGEDSFWNVRDAATAKRIAWRAYCRGKKDGRMLHCT